MCQSHTVQKEESDEWFSSLQYLNVSINDLSISELFLDNGSNSKHITESLGWFTDMPVSIKDKDGKTVTATGNFTHIDNGEPEPILCLEALDPPKEKQDLSSQVSTISSSSTSEKNLKKITGTNI
ncbi:hypothetical protein Glove_292g6 [Diversispora epigaea]|uniref:Uncharacterized protein n=1 Tax=Diversispora epigaea TaxID=1348612 RepID=A0A397I6C1_9GLOM|nr:hypothetical protein Glove_292g6 [Diversispora epigaea]